MGVDRPRDMEKMLEVVKPNIGILTNIGEFPSHLKYFKNAKHIAKEKNMPRSKPTYSKVLLNPP